MRNHGVKGMPLTFGKVDFQFIFWETSENNHDKMLPT